MIDSSSTSKETPYRAFSAKLKSLREAIGLDHKEAAQQLKLNENIIVMLESGILSSRLPFTFIRGYLRNYCKLLEVPETEVNHIINHLQSEMVKTPESSPSTLPSDAKLTPSTSLSNVSIKILTIIILLTLFSLFAIWWVSEKPVQTIPVVPPPLKNHATITEPAIKMTKIPNLALLPEENQFIQKYAISIFANIIILLFIFYLSLKYFQKPAVFYNKTYRHYPSNSRLNRSIFFEHPVKKLIGPRLLKVVLSAIILGLLFAGYFGWQTMTQLNHNHAKQIAKSQEEMSTASSVSENINHDVEIDKLDLVVPDQAILFSAVSKPSPIQTLFSFLIPSSTEMATIEKSLTDPTSDFGPLKPIAKPQKKMIAANRPHYLMYDDDLNDEPDDISEYSE